MGNRSGFTLLELILVVAIIVVLVGAMMPVFNITRREAQEAMAKAELDNIKTASLMYRADTNTWPTTGNTGAGLMANNASAAGWDGPYLNNWTSDPWNSPYNITQCGQGLCANSTGSGSVISILITANRSNP